MKELFAALVQAQAKLGFSVKNSINPHFKSKYADLEAVVEAVRPVHEFGLGYIQVFKECQGGAAIETIIIHSSGESFNCGYAFVPATKSDAHGYGSAIKYARRYSLETAFGIPSSDDDGNAAVNSLSKGPVNNFVPPRSEFEEKLPRFIAEIESEYSQGADGIKVANRLSTLAKEEKIQVWSRLSAGAKKWITDAKNHVEAEDAPNPGIPADHLHEVMRMAKNKQELDKCMPEIAKLKDDLRKSAIAVYKECEAKLKGA